MLDELIGYFRWFCDDRNSTNRYAKKMRIVVGVIGNLKPFGSSIEYEMVCKPQVNRVNIGHAIYFQE